ncbi:MAG: hypothetical protein IV085_09645 [Thiobacillus sp.]|nr:hypothetical protein [Thiobacillus sp.]
MSPLPGWAGVVLHPVWLSACGRLSGYRGGVTALKAVARAHALAAHRLEAKQPLACSGAIGQAWVAAVRSAE